MNTVRVGIVGFGLSGSVFHAPLLLADARFEVAAVQSSQPDKVHALFPRAQVHATLEPLLADPSLELLVITTPNELHFPTAHAALSRGKHVVLEKPFVVSSSEGTALITQARDAGLTLSVFHNRRWDNGFLTARDLVDRGVLGDVLLFEAHFDRFRPEVRSERWREQQGPGTGVLYDLGSHLIDQAVTLLGVPQAVSADLATQRRNAAVDDYFHVVLFYGPARAILHVGTVTGIPGPVVAVHGTRGSYVKQGLDGQESALRNGARPGSPGWGTETAPEAGYLAIGGAPPERIPTLPGAYESFYDGVFRAIRDGVAPPVTAESALTVIRLIEQCIESSGTGRRIVVS